MSCPSSIRHQDSNSQPLKHESSPINSQSANGHFLIMKIVHQVPKLMLTSLATQVKDNTILWYPMNCSFNLVISKFDWNRSLLRNYIEK